MTETNIECFSWKEETEYKNTFLWMYKPQSLQSLVHALMSARGSGLVKKRGCLIMLDLSGSDKNLVQPKKLEESLKTNKKAPVGVSFAGPPNHPFVSSRHVHPDYHENENYDEVGDS